MKRFVVACAACVAAGWGAMAAGTDGDNPIRLAFVGNSITRHPPRAELGWTNDWGMAASAADKDYVHLVARGLEKRTGRKVAFKIYGSFWLEREYGNEEKTRDALQGVVSNRPEIVVLAYGENVGGLTNAANIATYERSYRRTVRMMKDIGARVVVRTPFWDMPHQREVLRRIAREEHVLFADCSDLGQKPEMRADGRFKHGGVAYHPYDTGMAAMADRILAALVRNAAETAEMSVDFTQPCGELKRLNGIVNTIKLTQYANSRIRAEYAALEPPYVRFHDAALTNPGAEVMDVSRIFPLFHLDENDPRNYDFRPTDDLLALTRSFCTEIEFKIGESIEHYEHRYRVNPPTDRAKYARICLNIIRHYNEGWADGFRWNIRRWSVWEEPDNTKLFNGDFRKEFFPLYAEIVRAIKEKYPDYQVGGCATRGREMFRAEQFVSYCREQKLPLDFCSITDYRRALEPMFAVGDELRRILDTNGFSRTTIDLAEWHYEPANWTPAPGRDRMEVYRELTGANGGAFTASMLLLGQDSVYDRMLYYLADDDGGFWGLRGGEGGELNSHWYALKAFADLSRLRHRVKTSAPRERGYAAAATRAEDGRAALMVAAFCPSDSEPVRVSVKGAGRPTEVLLEDGEAHRLSACDGWTFADGTLTLPNAGRSAVWLVTFGGYRVLRLPHLEGGKIAPKTDWTRSDLVDEDGRLAFAFVVPREMIVRGSPLIERIRALTRKTFGAVPEVYGDDDNEKTSQAPALIALGMVGPIRHPKLLAARFADDEEAYAWLETLFREVK